ncbi:immunoglobulin kappa light chain-like [Mastacembelus armatus]|uniref:immunoglobulin kappa light chain-like n=1 Tax=Mastacembelus armatus TaxID=205130 RepID=UPI000E457DBB|nr:immunoglobulin kappa light chain-like [Mastacembelus armatus]
MTSLNFVFYLTCLFLGKMAQKTTLKPATSVQQMRRFELVNVGDRLTLQCFYNGGDSAWFFWYKQALGQKPKPICSFYVYDTKITFYDKFQNIPRFTLDTGNGKNHLTISDLEISDSATYYCARSYTYVMTFAEGTVVSVQGSGLNIPAQVHQSASESIQPGGSVTLNCTVHTGTCDGEHRVYWFKHSGKAHPGLIYTHRGSNDQCERKPETQTHSCVYNLPMNSLNLSDAGTYYCAVVSCGRVLFGNGTRLNIEHKSNNYLVYFLSGALTITTILVVLLALSVYKISKRNNVQCTASKARSSAPLSTNLEDYQNTENVHYAALSVNLPNRPRRQRNNSRSECVYSSVKQ